VNWIDLTQVKHKYQAVLKAMLQLLIPQQGGNIWIAEKQLASQAEIWSMGWQRFMTSLKEFSAVASTLKKY
jgi:hypothetical protein